MGRAFIDFVHPDDRERLRSAQRGLNLGHESEYQLRVRAADGRWLSITVGVGPYFDDEGQIIGRAGIWRDVRAVEPS